LSTASQDNSRANRCYLVGPFTLEPGRGRSTRSVRKTAATSIRELGRLCDAAGLIPVAAEIVHVRTPHPALYLGHGQAERIIAGADEADASVIVFDNTLSPVHLRNWARAARREVYDRHAVILEIFSRRAKTREAQLQVELARARYTQSHLVGMWQHLGRQGGGSRLAKGEGEKQIEIDRRRLAARVYRARNALDKVGKQRRLRRQGRRELFQATLVGYTNAGKSSLLNTLTDAKVRTADQLFASLDSTTRRLEYPDGRAILLSDTVGFIRNLPPDLVDAFHSTLEEVLEADVLLIVVDASDADVEQHLRTTVGILSDIGATESPRILVLNKIDRTDPSTVHGLVVLGSSAGVDEVIPVSAATGEGTERLNDCIIRFRTDPSVL
jgi:GTPase